MLTWHTSGSYLWQQKKLWKWIHQRTPTELVPVIHKRIMVIKQHETTMLGTQIYKGCSAFLQPRYEEARSAGRCTEACVAAVTLLKKIRSLSSPWTFSAWFLHAQFSWEYMNWFRTQRSYSHDLEVLSSLSLFFFLNKRKQRNNTGLIFRHKGAGNYSLPFCDAHMECQGSSKHRKQKWWRSMDVEETNSWGL